MSEDNVSYKKVDFIHLRVRSLYSLLEGAIHIGDLVKYCQNHRMPAIALTENGNLFSSLDFSLQASSNGIQPIMSVIINIDCDKNRKNLSYDHKRIFDKIILIAKNEIGYRNLLKLVSLSYLESDKSYDPYITLKQLETRKEGLILLTGGIYGPIGRLFLQKKEKEAEDFLVYLQQVFSDNLYIELMRHGLDEEKSTEPFFIKLAQKYNIGLVATNDVYFFSIDMHTAHDALICIADGRFTIEDDRRRVSKECYLKSPRQMKTLFADIPEALENTVNIAKRCSYFSQSHKPMLPHYDCGQGRSESEELRYMAKLGLDNRIAQHVYTPNLSEEEKQKIAKPYYDRLEYELDIIIQMDFPGYFLIVSDFIKWSKRSNIPVGPGRGSGAGSIIAWSLEITDLDPLRFGLLFERFLNPERVSMPDFDIDFCQERREEVIKYVQNKYGKDKVAQIITFGKLQAKLVLKDVGRVLQMPYAQVDRISKMIPFNPVDPVTLSKAIEMDADLKKMKNQDPEIAYLMDIALKLEGLNRHASTHAAGVVIADRSVDEIVPLYLDPKSDMPVSSYSMKYTELSGLVKFDFLGLKTLTVISKACEFIKQKNIDIDISKIPLDDKKTFDLLSEGNSVGVFQLESAGMRDTLRKLRPDNIEDIIAIISLYRPGPMDNIPSYIARKHKLEEPDYLDPMLEAVLKETYGVIIYQEQVMQIAQIMGGYSLGGADLLRRAMGKKIASEMDKQRKIFVKGAIENNVSQQKASSIFDLVAKFAGYGFNKSHAAAYAMISYQTAYLRANYLVEFLCASMNLEINDTDKITIFIQDAKNQNIKILPPDLNISKALFTPEKCADGTYAIRYGLAAIKNVGLSAMQEVEKVREKVKTFKDIFDYASKFDSKIINRKQLENFIKAGIFDKFHKNRRQIFENIDKILSYGQSSANEKKSKQGSLFSFLSMPDKPQLPEIEDWSVADKLNHEFEAFGFFLYDHPVYIYKNYLNKIGIVYAKDFSNKIKDGESNIILSGVVTAKRMKSSKKGRFANLSVSDPTGIFELSIYNDEIFTSARDLLDTGSLILIRARARKDEGGVRITADSIESLFDIANNYNGNIRIFLNDTKEINKLQQLLISEERAKSLVSLQITVNNKKIEVKLPGKYKITSDLFPKLEELKTISKIVEYN